MWRNYLFLLWQVSSARSLRTRSFGLREDMSLDAHAQALHVLTPSWVLLTPIHMTSLLHCKLTGVCFAATNASYTARRMMETLEITITCTKGQLKGMNSKILTIVRIYHRLKTFKATKLKRLGSLAELICQTFNIKTHQKFLMQWQTVFHTLGIQSPKLRMVSYIT